MHVTAICDPLVLTAETARLQMFASVSKYDDLVENVYVLVWCLFVLTFFAIKIYFMPQFSLNFMCTLIFHVFTRGGTGQPAKLVCTLAFISFFRVFRMKNTVSTKNI